ncbi:hypothetical protein BFJ70_g4457 [Fusarium oxysporum]|nr:hypothetical protein BFJ70_g4457 [Fusarium oxysporum]
MDFILAGFPLIALHGLNMKPKERHTICLSLSLGVFAGICGIFRTTGLTSLSNSQDYLYAISYSAIWTASEVTAKHLLSHPPSPAPAIQEDPKPRIEFRRLSTTPPILLVLLEAT